MHFSIVSSICFKLSRLIVHLFQFVRVSKAQKEFLPTIDISMNIDQDIFEMKRLAAHLCKYEKTEQDKKDLAILKVRELLVYGYELTVVFSREQCTDGRLDTLQISSKYQPFLPFNVLCEVAIKFLGDKGLGLVEYIISGKKIYVWNAAFDLNDNPMPVPDNKNYESRNYGGLDYTYAPSKVIIFLT